MRPTMRAPMPIFVDIFVGIWRPSSRAGTIFPDASDKKTSLLGYPPSFELSQQQHADDLSDEVSVRVYGSIVQSCSRGHAQFINS